MKFLFPALWSLLLCCGQSVCETNDLPIQQLRSQADLGHTAEAEASVRRYLKANGGSAEAHYLLGYILFKEQKAKESLREYTEGAKFRKPGAYDLAVVGGDYVLLNDYPDADKWFTQSLAWNPGDFQTLYYLGRTKYNENRFDEAATTFKQCLQIDPKSVKAEDNLGLSYQGLGKMEEAIAAYKTAIEWQSTAAVKNAGPYIDLGSLLLESDRSDEAVPYLSTAVQIVPDDVRAHRELGKAYLHLNQLDTAQSELERAVQLAPESAPTYFVLAQVYRKKGWMEKARHETERYTELSGAHSSSDNAH